MWSFSPITKGKGLDRILDLYNVIRFQGVSLGVSGDFPGKSVETNLTTVWSSYLNPLLSVLIAAVEGDYVCVKMRLPVGPAHCPSRS